MADARLFLLNTPQYIIIDVSKVVWEFVSFWDTLDAALVGADTYIVENKLNKVVIIETSYGLMRKVNFVNSQPPNSTPQ